MKNASKWHARKSLKRARRQNHADFNRHQHPREQRADRLFRHTVRWLAPGLGEHDERYDTGLQARWRYGRGLQIAGPVEEQFFTTQGRFNATSLHQQLQTIAEARTALIRVKDAGGPGEQLTCYILPQALNPRVASDLHFA